MSLLEVLVLAIVQGVTEFLPISSSGHLVLTIWIFGWDDPGTDFDVAVHVGTLAAVLVVFWREWIGMATSLLAHAGLGRTPRMPAGPAEPRPWRLLQLLVVGTIPLVIVGAIVRDSLDDDLRDPTWVGVFLLATGAGIAVADLSGRARHALASLRFPAALAIGIAQAIAVLPGISRSGATIVGGMLAGLAREDAARFAFLLAVPAIAGAGLLTLIDLIDEGARDGASAGEMILGAVIAFATAVLALRALIALVRRHSLLVFVAYCGLAGGAVLIARAAGA